MSVSSPALSKIEVRGPAARRYCDGRAKLRIADVHAGAAEGLLGRADGGFGGFVLGRILVQLRLADGVDPGQRHGAVVVVAGFDGLCPG